MTMAAFLLSCMQFITVVSNDDPVLKGHPGFTDTKGNIFISQDYKDDRSIINHECGHRLDVLAKGKDVKQLSKFSDMKFIVFDKDPSEKFYEVSWKSKGVKKAGARFISQYASTDHFEDFAETFYFYSKNKTRTRRMFPEKVKAIESILPPSSQ